MNPTDDEQWLALYLDEALEPERMAWIEKRLREEPALNQKLERLRRDASPAAVHTVGMAWVAGRLTCPTRTQWTKYLSGLLEDDLSGYLRFHLEVIECPFCRANVSDLQQRESTPAGTSDLAEKSARAAGWSK